MFHCGASTSMYNNKAVLSQGNGAMPLYILMFDVYSLALDIT